jgi:cytochrome oxidase Cu insertion factor (SCO1/SenC/PrrC family)
VKRAYSLAATALVVLVSACGAPAATSGQPVATVAPTAAPVEPNAAMTTTEVMTDATPMSESEAMTAPTGVTETEPMTDGAMMSATGTTDAAAVAAADRPAWQQLPLVNARTGESFTLADFAGKTVFVEPMATWCTNCRQQLNNVKAATATLADADVVFVALSVETNLDNASLAAYADANGFDWTFAVITPELLQELAALFGRTITNPPATPHFIIRPDGSTSDLITGIESAEQLISQLQSTGG